MAKFVNLTPHDLTIFKGDDKIVIPASGKVARVTNIDTLVGDVNGIPVFARDFGDVIDLPAPQPDTIFVVSALVLGALKGKDRMDVVAPDTGKGAVRDNEGRIIGVKSFIVNPK